jgi:hypothetical protein
MLAKLFLQYVLATSLGVGVDEGWATVFGYPGDPHAGGLAACNQRPIPQDELVCAHRWLPCGTEVVVFNLERPGVSTCVVTDRGPYGVNARTGRWRGIIDLAPAASRAIRHDGRDLVRLFYQLPPPGDRVYENQTWLTPRRRRTPAL